jgi:hypothetical protein
VGINYDELRRENAERLATLKSEMAEHIARHPELLLEQCRRLAEQAKTKVVERSAQSIPVVTKRRDDSLVDPTDEQRWSNLDSWCEEKFIATFADAWPLMWEKVQSQFEATNAGLRAEINELRERLRSHVHTSNET